MKPFDRRRVGLGLLASGLLGPAAAAEIRPIVAWGDSLTFGTGARTKRARYPAVLAAAFSPPRHVRNAGVGGETSTQIAARMLADVGSHGMVAVIWAGRNNYGDGARVLADIRAMTDRVRDGRFLVLSILNADVPEEYRGEAGYRSILTLNDALREHYGRRYLDVRTALVDRGLANAKIVRGTGDELDVARDVPPRALRDDHIHLNDTGQAVIAAMVRDALVMQGL